MNKKLKLNINSILINNYIYKNNKIKILYFWSEWCISCKIFYKIIDQIEKFYKNKIKIIKININYNNYLLEKFSIKNIPSIVIIKNKIILYKKFGNLTKEYIKTLINKIL